MPATDGMFNADEAARYLGIRVEELEEYLADQGDDIDYDANTAGDVTWIAQEDLKPVLRGKHRERVGYYHDDPARVKEAKEKMARNAADRKRARTGRKQRLKQKVERARREKGNS